MVVGDSPQRTIGCVRNIEIQISIPRCEIGESSPVMMKLDCDNCNKKSMVFSLVGYVRAL